MRIPERAQRSSRHQSGSSDPGLDWDPAIREGDFAAAYEANDAVLRARDPATRDDPARPYHERWVWDGTPPDGRRVLVRCYHGLGDTLQFARYLGPLRRRAVHVTVEVQAALLPMVRSIPGWDALVAFDQARPLPRSECDIEVMELGHALRLVPDPAPYLRAAPLGVRGVGLCWAASGWGVGRDVPGAALLAAVGEGCISLQRGAAAAELDIPDPLGGDMDLCRMASLVAGLDVVVTIDTMIAHLAGALGRPTVVLLQHAADWRWGRAGRVGSDWYRTVRTLRQEAPGDWGPVLARLPGTLDGMRGC